MAGSVIGSLRVNLGMDSAQFRRGLKSAETGMQRFARLARTGLIAVTAAATTATTALGYAVANTARETANLAAEARTAGVSFEEFQRLKYAAEQNLVSVEALTDGLKEMNLRADEFILTGGGSAAEAFNRLGYSADELATKLQQPEQLFTDIIDRLGHLDTAAQIRIADEIFGGTGGEQFVRFLNEGADGIERLKIEADGLGLVLSNSTGAAALRFNENLQRIQRSFQGVINHITAALLPSLEYLSDALFNSTADGEMLERMAHNLANAFKLVVTAAVVTGEAIKGVGYSMTTLMNAMLYAQRLDFRSAFVVLQNGFQSVGESAANAIDFVNGLWAAVEAGPGTGGGSGGTGTTGGNTPFQPVIAGAGAAAEAVDLVGDSVTGLTEKTQTFGEMAFDAFKGMGSQLADAFFKGGNIAKNVLDVLIDRVGRLADMLIDQAFNLGLSALFNVLTGGGGGVLGGVLGGLFGGGGYTPGFGALFQSGGFTGFGGVSEPAGIVHKGEYVLNADATRRIGLDNLEAMNSGGMPGGKTVIVQMPHMPMPREYMERFIGEMNKAIGAGVKLKMA